MAQGIVNNGYHIHDERYYTESEIDTKVSELNSSISSEVSARQAADTELQNKINLLTNYVTPEMFGAVGDGQTDDTEAIKNAISNSNIILFPAGEYKITETINLRNGVRIYGFGVESKILTNSCDAFSFSVGRSGSFIIDGLFLRGDGNHTMFNINSNDSSGSYNAAVNGGIYNTRLENFRNGIVVENHISGIFLSNITIGEIFENSILFNGDDSVISNIYMDAYRYKGLVVNGSNNVINNVQIKGCGSKNPFSLDINDSYSLVINGYKNMLSNISIQDGTTKGALVAGNSCYLSLEIDKIGFNLATETIYNPDAIGCEVTGKSNIVDIVMFTPGDYGKKIPKYAYSLSNTAKFNTITVTDDWEYSDRITSNYNNSAINNRIFWNGFDVSGKIFNLAEDINDPECCSYTNASATLGKEFVKIIGTSDTINEYMQNGKKYSKGTYLVYCEAKSDSNIDGVSFAFRKKDDGLGDFSSGVSLGLTTDYKIYYQVIENTKDEREFAFRFTGNHTVYFKNIFLADLNSTSETLLKEMAAQGCINTKYMGLTASRL